MQALIRKRLPAFATAEYQYFVAKLKVAPVLAKVGNNLL
jgi:hypothetical protein